MRMHRAILCLSGLVFFADFENTPQKGLDHTRRLNGDDFHTVAFLFGFDLLSRYKYMPFCRKVYCFFLSQGFLFLRIL